MSSYLVQNLRCICIAIFSLCLSSAFGRRCYVCSITSKDYGKPHSCDRFNWSNADLFVKDCPPSSHSCSSQRQANVTVNMACELLYIEDCQTANNIQYCYCKDDLCNGNFNKPPPIPAVGTSIGLYDDEDFKEGSGFESISVNNDINSKVVAPTNPRSNGGHGPHERLVTDLILIVTVAVTITC